MFAGYKNVSIKSTYADEKQGGEYAGPGENGGTSTTKNKK